MWAVAPLWPSWSARQSQQLVTMAVTALAAVGCGLVAWWRLHWLTPPAGHEEQPRIVVVTGAAGEAPPSSPPPSLLSPGPCGKPQVWAALGRAA